MNRALLRQELAAHFNREELRDLTFDMGIDYENFPEAKDGFVRELVSYCQRHGRLVELVDKLQQLRPEVDWPTPDAPAPAPDRPADTLTWSAIVEYSRRQAERFLGAAQGTPERPNIFVPALYVPSQSAEAMLQTFLDSDAVGLAILGEPGVGKTNLLCQWALNLAAADHAVFYYDCGGSIQADVEAEIARDLGLASAAPLDPVLEQVNQLAGQAGRRFVLIFDAINEFRQGNQMGTAALLKRIDALVGRSPPGNVRIVFSCRTVPWRQMDRARATQLFWHRYFQPADGDEPLFTLTEFDHSTFIIAYEKYQAHFRLQTPWRSLPPALQERLHKPLFLRMLAEAYRERHVPLTYESLTLNIFQRYYNERVQGRRDQRFVDWLVMEMYHRGRNTLFLDDLEEHVQLRDEVLSEDPESSYQRLLAEGVISEIPGDLYQSPQVRFMYDQVGSYALALHFMRVSGGDGRQALNALVQRREFHLAWEAAQILLLLEEGTTVFADIAQSNDVELRELAVAGLVEMHADKPRQTTEMIQHLLQLDSAEAHRTGLKAAYYIGPEAQEIFLWVAAQKRPELRRVRQATKDALYLIWRADPDFVNQLMYALIGRIELTAPRQIRPILEFIIDLSVTIYINHCDSPGVPEHISDLYYELIKNRLHLDLLDVGILGPTFEKLVAKAIGAALAKPVMETFQYSELLSQQQLAQLSAGDKARLKRVLSLVEPGTDLSAATADIAWMISAPVPFINLLAAMPLAVHAYQDFTRTEPLLHELFDQVDGHGRLWLIISLAVLLKDTPSAWVELLETFTRRLVEENPDTFYREQDGFLTHFDITLISLGLAYGKRGVAMPYFERLIEGNLAAQEWEQLGRVLAGLGAVGFYYPQAIFHTLIAAVERFDTPEIQEALIKPLSIMRIIHLDEVDIFLQLIEANDAFKRRVAAAVDIEIVSRYIYSLGIYNNAIFDALYHPKMRRHFLVGSLEVLIDTHDPKDYMAYYAEASIRMSREAKYRLIEWTKPD